MTHRPLDYAALAKALLDQAPRLLEQWMPEGQRRGSEWVCGDLSGSAGDSCSVNIHTGRWADFATGDSGGDLISLYAAMHDMRQHDAAMALMVELGWVREDEGRQVVVPPRVATKPAEREDPVARKSIWEPIVPVPEHAPPCRMGWGFKDKKTGHYVELTAVAHWAYVLDGRLYGYVARFHRKDSRGQIVKETIPFTWCKDSTRTDVDQYRWHCKVWADPRPLFLPGGALPEGMEVALVEGEKCAQAGHDLLPGRYLWATWPGGTKSWQHGAWEWIRGRRVVLWPDADAKRARLSVAERDAGVSEDSKPLLPAERQPGLHAMLEIGKHLRDELGCSVRIVGMDEPGVRPDGWDIADAIAEGWTADRVQAHLDAAMPLELPAEMQAASAAANAGGTSTPSIAAAVERTSGGERWPKHLILTAKMAIRPCRENIALAMEGITRSDGTRIPGAPELAGLVAYNEFTNQVDRLRETPWGAPAGPWRETDELELGEYLARRYGLPPMPRQTLEEAVSLVARRNAYHPVREVFSALRGTWDGTQRLRIWLMRCARKEGARLPEEDESDRLERLHDLADTDPDARYLALVGQWWMMAIVARVMEPGCKFDYMPILEGRQGWRKSTLAATLGMSWFADTGLVLGDKDSYQNLQGVLVYEWGELDSLNRSEVTKVKQFVSSRTDRFRASFDRRPADYPRQCVFVGTTNESHYLSDPTGNRRFWPIRVTAPIDIDWARENLGQLYAEALDLLDRGERFYPDPSETRDLFERQQLERTVENALESAVRKYLYDENQKINGSALNGALIDEITLADLLSALGISVDKQTQVLTKQASAALGRMGWERGRASGKGGKVRPWVYRRPKQDPGDWQALPEIRQADPCQSTTDGGADDPPF